ncbi:hypothetical protein ND856_19325 [Leptospira bandrabouensis]|uniref:DUF6602 domain-containing protein n=1 Tax=Leptospira bandrabouensis TaxID=2484903 RepID=UPI00223C8C49|nr:DUF6602 domain-containing protein [Leptospira bandrabouensis]MCW7460450.1 hypothetical protein [Leptospira bandrabouensis]MCW7479460.1 hypothetical protein [Leptospira bandrabouensis]MCW7487145.1 hypothetical protein [Leptospira bandrabouensis]
MEHSHRLISRHFSHIKKRLIQFSNHFDIIKQGDLKGYGREALVTEFLKQHLPDNIEYLTGEIIDYDDNRSGQIDIILQSKNLPKIPLYGNIHLSFSDSVIAIIEVKSDLNTQHLEASLKSFQKVKSLRKECIIKGDTQMVDLNRIPCIIFAYSGPSLETLLKHINTFREKNNISLDNFAPDLVVILDSDFYLCRNNGWNFPIAPGYENGGYFRNWAGLADENLVGLYNLLNNLIRSFSLHPPGISLDTFFDKSKGLK